MQLSDDWLHAQGDDAPLLRAIDAALSEACARRIGIAVSGGSDSTALLHLTHLWARQTGAVVEAVTVDHGLRDEAAREAADVAAFCGKIYTNHNILRWSGRETLGNVQAAARDARYRLMADWAKSRHVDYILLGHTQDDIAETFLMRLTRKSGVDGLAAMDASFCRHDMHWKRPLTQISRKDLRAHLRRHDLSWSDDPSNDNEKYERTRARRVIAALKPLELTPTHLQHSATALADAKSALDHYTHQEAKNRIKEVDGDILYATDPSLPDEIHRRLINCILRWIGGASYTPRWQSLIALEQHIETSSAHTLAGCRISKEHNGLRISREYQAVKNTQSATHEIWDNRWRVAGPHAPHLRVAALGDAVKECPAWRESSLPYQSVRASPAIFDGEILIAAPIAGYNPDWSAQIVAPFIRSLLSH